MPTKKEVGLRMKMTRFRKGMTLKEVATGAGMSATHISEIERGKTSPTIGALQKIASALGERPAHFVEESDVSTVSLIKRNQRARYYACDTGGKVFDLESLTAAPPWAMTRISRITGDPGEQHGRPPELGEMALHCVRGMIRVTIGDESFVLRDGDTLQFFLNRGFTFENPGEEEFEGLAIEACPPKPIW